MEPSKSLSMKKFILPALCLLVLALTSCNNLRIVKRHYTGGFYVETGSGKTNHETKSGSNYAAEPSRSVVAEDKLPATETVVVNHESQKQPAAIAFIAPSEPPVITEDNRNTINNNEERITNEEKTASEKIKSDSVPTPAGDVPLWVYVLLAIFLPPLAVYLKVGVSNIFWIDLILFILGYGLFRFSFYLWGAALAAVVIAFLVIFDVL